MASFFLILLLLQRVMPWPSSVVTNMISLCPRFSCAAYCLSNVRGEKPLASLCPELLLCGQLVGLYPYTRALGESASSDTLC